MTMATEIQSTNELASLFNVSAQKEAIWSYGEAVEILNEPNPLPNKNITPEKDRKAYTFTLDKDTAERLDELSQKLNCSKSTIVSYFIRSFVKEVAVAQVEKNLEKEIQKNRRDLKKCLK